MKRLAVLSSDVNEVYSFFAPLTALAWQRCGWNPLLILVGDPALWSSEPRIRFVLERVLERATVAFVPPVPEYRVGTTAQVVRLLASAVPAVGSGDYLLTSDVDMLPLNADYFLQQDFTMDFNIFGADAYADIQKGHFPPKFPICYLGSRAETWREVMGIQTCDLKEEAHKALRGRADTWDNDEMYFTSKLYPHPLFSGEVQKISDLRYRKGECELILRTWPASRAALRIDREVWGFDGSSNVIDCHCFRPGFERVDVLRSIVSKYFPSDLAWFDSYLLEYLRLRRVHG